MFGLAMMCCLNSYYIVRLEKSFFIFNYLYCSYYIIKNYINIITIKFFDY